MVVYHSRTSVLLAIMLLNINYKEKLCIVRGEPCLYCLSTISNIIIIHIHNLFWSVTPFSIIFKKLYCRYVLKCQFSYFYTFSVATSTCSSSLTCRVFFVEFPLHIALFWKCTSMIPHEIKHF